MEKENHQAIVGMALRQMLPAYLIDERSKKLLYVSEYIQSQLGYDPVGQTCYQVFMGKKAPCMFCPELAQAGAGCRWEHFATQQERLYSVGHQMLECGGTLCRAGWANDITDTINLSRSIADYLSLTKMLSEMQMCIIGAQEKTVEIIMKFLRRHFRAEQVAVCRQENGRTEMFLLNGEDEVSCHVITGDEPALAHILAVTPAVLKIDLVTYAIHMVDLAEADFWKENRAMVLNIVRLYLENAQLRMQIEWENHHDKSTALFNRAHFVQQSQACYQSLAQVGVIFIDIDNLKKINDEQGHDMGDRLIGKAADVLRAVADDRVHPYRMGGDEFVLVCCDAGPETVSALLDRVIMLLHTHNEQIEMPQLSLSAGWACGQAPFKLEALISEADEKMYAEKRAKKAAR